MSADVAPPCIDIHNHLGVDLLFYLQGDFPYAQDWPTLLRDGDRGGVTHFGVFPMVSTSAWDLDGIRAGRRDFPGHEGAVPYAFENRRLAKEVYELQGTAADRALPFAMVDPARELPGQLRELTALCQDYRFNGLKIQPTILQSPIRNLLDEGRGLLEFSAEHDLPWIIHSSIDPTDDWSQCTDILAVAEAWPQVRFCLAHSCRFHLPSLQRVAALPNTWIDCSAHLIHCQAAVQNLPAVAVPAERLDADYTDGAAVLEALAATCPGKLMWGSDSPFYTYVDPQLALTSSYAAEVAALRALPAGLQQEITADNTLTFLGLSHETLRSFR